MSDFGQYMLMQARTEAASERYNYASRSLEYARIMERLAQIKSQHEPLASLLEQPLTRETLYAVAHYVAIGRMP